jgi:8-oxo-dGTP pyrophosphatase MutT (NUDIX family)
MIDSWDILSHHDEADYRIFSVRRTRMRAPHTGREHDFYVIDAPAWINVVPVTADGQLVLIRQYRPGTDAVTLEIPGGMVDEGETPEAAARRELREETGYAAEDWTNLGAVSPNPALQSNRCHTFLAENAREDGAPELDVGEDIETTLIAPAKIPALITEEKITHALVVAAFYLYEQHQRDP